MTSIPHDLLACFFSIVLLILPIICETPPGKPVITITPAVAMAGTSATVTCSSVGGDPAPTVKISKNGVLVSDDAETADDRTVNNYEFTVQYSDHYAIFECSVDNGVLQNPLTETQYLIVTKAEL